MAAAHGDGLWLKLKKNRVAVASLFYIVLLSVAALTAFLWMPDRSPDANQQFPNLNLKSPLYQAKFLKLENSSTIETPIWQGLWQGFPSNAKYIEIGRHTVMPTGLEVHDIRKGRKELYTWEEVLPHMQPVDIQAQFQNGQTPNLPIINRTFWLGTDKYGRCVLSRLILGVRLSLAVGFLAVVVSLLIGIVIGLVGGYYGGWVDRLCLYLINVTWSIPTLLLVFAIVLALGKGLWVIFLAVGLTMWVDVARLVRGQTLKIKAEQFVDAAKSLGFSDTRIMLRHILPNLVGPILVIVSANFASAILVEAGLSYLGFGINPPSPSLGNMLNENYGFALSGYWYLAVAPSLAIMGLVLALNSLSAGLRDATDVRLQD